MKSANQEQCSNIHLNGVKKHSAPIATSQAFQLKEMKDNTRTIDRNDRLFKSVYPLWWDGNETMLHSCPVTDQTASEQLKRGAHEYSTHIYCKEEGDALCIA